MGRSKADCAVRIVAGDEDSISTVYQKTQSSGIRDKRAYRLPV